ncbi:DsbA family oxidoreductase [Altererythrobacter aquiaggeris]|uniref:DsbA family oxidoreductase n=1 Tax=Aestuarierythrobacter aquiaggeris TaxID=1898396 RepID=UPI00301647E3
MTGLNPRKMAIDIYSDVMCPWCIIGYGQLQQALDQLAGEIEAQIRWRPFELNPDMAPEGEDRTEHIARKYGRTLDESKDIQSQMRQVAGQARVSLDYEGNQDPAPPAMMWNTFGAHILLTYVLDEYGPDKQTAVKLALFRAHFNERRRIGARDVLLELAEAEGIERAAAVAALDDKALAARVRAAERQAFEANITGVPAMIIDGKFLIPGAQQPDVYVNALRRVAAKTG